MPPTSEAVVDARGITRRFGGSGAVIALAGVDLVVAPGSLTVVAGASGSGKSTLLGIVAALDRPDEGRVEVVGVELTAMSARRRREWRRHSLGYIGARPSENLTDHHDAAGNVMWAASLRGTSTARLDRAAARERMATVGLGGLGDRGIRDLSTGEQQRLAFVCALVGAPSVVVADEPTASLDATSATALVEVMRSLVGGGATLVVASHDERVIDAADALVRLDHGRRVE